VQGYAKTAGPLNAFLTKDCSFTWTPACHNYSPTEGEALAAVWGISIFRPYVQGRHFTLQTDCSALTWLKDHVDPPLKLWRAGS